MTDPSADLSTIEAMRKRIAQLEEEVARLRDQSHPPRGTSCLTTSTEQTLNDEREFLRTVIDTVPAIICAKNRTGHFTLANKSLAHAYGTRVEELEGRTDSDFSATPEETESFRRDDLEVIDGRTMKLIPQERITYADGSVHWLSTVKVPLVRSDGSCSELLAVATDITDRKRAEDALAAEKEHLSVTLSSIGDGVISTDTHGRIVLMNRVAEHLTGWTPGSAAGRMFSEIFMTIDETTRISCPDPVEGVLKTGKTLELSNHAVLISRTGEERIIADSAAPIRNASGDIIGVVLVFRDTTEKRRLMESAQRAEKLESIGLLAGGIAHDFNNLLTGIFGCIDAARAECAPQTAAAQHLSLALDSFERARSLTQRLLTFAKGGSPVRKVGSLAPIIRECATFSLSGSSIPCSFDLPDNLRLCEFDEHQIAQVIENIVINAKQAMPQGGSIHVSARNKTINSGQHPSLPPGHYIHITIRDTGNGMRRDTLTRIFDPFYTTKNTGTGLGLSISYSIIKKHDGVIEVESQPGIGSTFHIYLPASRVAKLPADTGKQAISHAGSGSILVMDDEPAIRGVMQRILESMGYSVYNASTGEEAVQIVRTTSAAIHVAILDLTVRGGMGGKEAITAIRALAPDIIAIASSGYSEDPAIASPGDYGFNASLRKPFCSADVAQVLNDTRPHPSRPDR